jgi:acetyltransferase-like isoleucine patch superfamily enzyme
MIYISDKAKISGLADIEDSVRGSKISVGDFSQIDSFVKVKPAGGSGNLVIGEYSYINSGCVLYLGNGITIGNHVLIAANCTLAPVNHAYKKRDVLIRDQGFGPSRGGIVIEDDVWIGVGVTILDGAHIGRGAVIGAQSLVAGEIPPYSICYGVPAKIQGYRE